MSSEQDDRLSNTQGNGRLGVLLLTFTNLLGGIGSVYFALDLFLAQHRDNVVFGLFGVVYTGSMGVSAVGLIVRKQWSWRVAIVAQIIAIACALIAAISGIHGAVTASGDFAYAAVGGGFLICLAAMPLAAIPLVGMLHLMKPSVRTLFHR